MKRRRSHRRKDIAIAAAVSLALLVGMAVVIHQAGKGGKPAPVPAHPPVTQALPKIVKEYALPGLLIKGCLFDLGISRQDIRITGNTVTVTVHELPPEGRILKAFEPLEGAGKVSMPTPAQVRVKIGGRGWDIFFSPVSPGLARCAIIVDDMGQSLQTAQILGGIDADLTFAVLPDSPDSRPVAEYLHARGREILLHLPMQGNGKDPGPGAILEGMSPRQVSAVLEEDLKRIPYFSGVNNHMGSVITADPRDMSLVFRELKDRKLFFVDSRTTNKSVCEPLAKDFKVPFIARDVFLDNEQNAAYITGQLQKLANMALKHSAAVAICHPHPETIAVLLREVPGLKKLGVEVVQVSSLLERPGEAP
jgi:polysaccharide deacetylase 2 family uncharacterized protein YibQ